MNALLLFASEAHEPNGIVIPSDINEVIWGSIGFLIVFGLIVWKGGPAIKAMWNARIERIRSEIETAEAARTEAEAKLAKVEADIANADAERGRILAEARETASSLKAQIIAKAGADAADLRARGAADAEGAKAQASSDLQAEVAMLALGAAEKVVANNLDSATQAELIENYIQKVGSGS
jgi:F-type H+-transporting ATPase subunit b